MDPATAMDSHPPKIMHACTSTLDRISSLPDSIIENILSDLPLQEAVKTSILSSAWRHKWRYIPEIVFDNEFYQSQSNKLKVNKLIWFDIFRILLLHCGTITSLKFCIDELETCPEVDQLFLFLCGQTIQEFMFHCGRRKSNRLPSHLFSCENLRKLTLSCCVFKAPPTFRGLHNLAHIAFDKVSFECEDFHQSFISHCLLLEHLTMSRCTGIPSFVIDFPNLKSLCLDYCSFTSFRFERSPQLATVEILQRVYDGESSNCLISFFDCLPALESIRVNYYFLKYLATTESQNRLPTDIQSLQALDLQDISFWNVKEVSWVLCLVMSSPNLKNLKIKAYHSRIYIQPSQLSKYEEASDFSSEQLRRVEMDNFSGTKPELEFVKFLLTKLALLEVLVTKCPVDSGPTKPVQVMEDLVQLPRVSPKAKIICLDP